MTDERSDVVAYDEIEMLARFLNGQLDPQKVAQVRKRLEDDPEFRDFAAPIVFAWSVHKHRERHPRPAGEFEKGWDEFTKRAGFVHQKRKAHKRLLWMLAIVVAAIGIPAIAMFGTIRSAWRDYRDYETVANTGRWTTLREGIFVQLAPGATLRSLREPAADHIHRVKLQGAARFRVQPKDTVGSFVPSLKPFIVNTANGDVSTPRAEFTVTDRADTTEVVVHRPQQRAFAIFVPLPTYVFVHSAGAFTPLQLGELDRARVVRGGAALKLPPLPEVPQLPRLPRDSNNDNTEARVP